MSEGSYSKLKAFWNRIGHSFSSLYDAPSTGYYLECEKGLFEQHFPDLRGKRVFKTDLWDEAKNTRILKWAAEQGAEVYGLDISRRILSEACLLFDKHNLGRKFVVSDLRDIAFGDGSFDYLYSMGTIEHFPEYTRALKECFRVMRRKGLAVFGVPNKLDPFLRPLMVTVLNRLGLYAYGYEKSFSMRQLEEMLTHAGFEVIGKTGILFMPGWLRMADLFFHVHRPRITALTSPLISLFRFFYRKFPSLRPHGYLIACYVRKP
ncbi:MAG: class I SAM-dependent methyltransferase [Candidatus Aminicenantes bacterium]|jgi:SAM-dependent methyltransferase